MHKITCILFLLFVSTISVRAQGSDMVLLKKKNNKTVRKYLAETPIHLITKNGERINGMIKKLTGTVYLSIPMLKDPPIPCGGQDSGIRYRLH